MYSVMIAEDEMLVRLGLKNSVDWGKFNMKVIADVADGKAAWETYERDRPNLIITDLKMPILGGMELIERIRENDNKTVIIILSCIEEFDLVRKAMSLEVMGYISKLTMTEEETEAILGKAQKVLDKLDESDSLKAYSAIDTDIIKEKLIKNYLLNHITSAEEFKTQIAKLNLRLNQARLLLCILEIDHYNMLQRKNSDENGQFIKFSMLNVLNELLSNSGRGEQC